MGLAATLLPPGDLVTTDAGEGFLACRPNAVAIGDLNGDGMLDMTTAYVNPNSRAIRAFCNGTVTRA